MLVHDVNRLMNFYPKIFYACRKRQPDPETPGEKLTANQLSILAHLDNHFPTTLKTLALHHGVTPSTMSIAVHRLLARGYISRQKDQNDGRITHLLLTPTGDAVKQSKALLDRKLVEELLSQMPDDAREQALNGLYALALAADNMQSLRIIERTFHDEC